MTRTENNEAEVQGQTAPEPTPQIAEKKRRHRWWLVLVCFLIILAGAGIGTFIGYRAGLQDRLNAQNDQKVMAATTQFTLGVGDLEAGRFEMARKRFDFVVSLDPGFPGVAEKLAEAMVKMAQALTPTPVPSPTASPTPDLRSEQQLYDQIKQDLVSQNWSAAISNIEALRNLNLDFKAVDVDGMYYIALRFIGVQNILNDGQLEVGIYNLTLSEQFAPLDVEAKNYRNWARQYIAAASFWGIDWAKVVTYFTDIYPALPNLRDSSGMTATNRFRIASIKYGDLLMSQGKFCEAQTQYQNAFNLAGDLMVAPTATAAADYCANPPGQPTAVEQTVTPTPTVTPTTGGELTPTPTDTPPAPISEPTTPGEPIVNETPTGG